MKNSIRLFASVALISLCSLTTIAQRPAGGSSPIDNVTATLNKLVDQVSELMDKNKKQEETISKLEKEVKDLQSDKEEYYKTLKNTLYMLLSMPYNDTNISFFTKYINEHPILLEDAKINERFNLLQEYKRLNNILVKQLKQIDALAKDDTQNRNLKKDYLKGRTLGIDEYEQINRIPFLSTVMEETTQRLQKFTVSAPQTFDDLIIILENPVQCN